MKEHFGWWLGNIEWRSFSLQPILNLVIPVTRQQKPILPTFADLIDMNQYVKINKKYRYILSAIDYFSRKVFAVALKKKDLATVIKGFDKIVEYQSKNTCPERLNNNGAESSMEQQEELSNTILWEQIHWNGLKICQRWLKTYTTISKVQREQLQTKYGPLAMKKRKSCIDK